jgi:hypothetical protein
VVNIFLPIFGRGDHLFEERDMLKRLFLLAALVLPAAHAQATGTLTINVIGKSTVANTAAYGTVVDALSPVNATTGAKVSGVTWSVNNPDFYTDFFGDLHTKGTASSPPALRL